MDASFPPKITSAFKCFKVYRVDTIYKATATLEHIDIEVYLYVEHHAIDII